MIMRPTDITSYSSRERRNRQDRHGKLRGDRLDAFPRLDQAFGKRLPDDYGVRQAKNCAVGTTYCGNGGLPFPGLVGARRQGAKDGSQHREPAGRHVEGSDDLRKPRRALFSSWYSGSASYVVAVLARAAGNAKQPKGVQSSTAAGSPVYWACAGPCDHALNKGDPKATLRRALVLS